MVINAYFAAKKFLILNDLFCQEELDFMLLSEKHENVSDFLKLHSTHCSFFSAPHISSWGGWTAKEL